MKAESDAEGPPVQEQLRAIKERISQGFLDGIENTYGVQEPSDPHLSAVNEGCLRAEIILIQGPNILDGVIPLRGGPTQWNRTQ
jgi:hypothetical protein